MRGGGGDTTVCAEDGIADDVLLCACADLPTLLSMAVYEFTHHPAFDMPDISKYIDCAYCLQSREYVGRV